MFGNDLYQFLFVFFRHATAQRVIKIGNYNAGFNITSFHYFFQAVKINTMCRR